LTLLEHAHDIARVLELFLIAILALHGFASTAILIVMLWHASRRHEARWNELPVSHAPLDKFDPPDLSYPLLERYPTTEIFPIMAEHFPEQYERYRRGQLSYVERQNAWENCCTIHDARAEIEELCS
jgi:hypothetical protein